MEQGEPETKKFRHSIFSDYMYDPHYQETFLKHWHKKTSFHSPNMEVLGTPFRVCKISNFLKSPEFMDKLKSELVDVQLKRNCTDLFQFEQSHDLVEINTPTIKLFYETFQRDLSAWFEKFTKISLNKKISMSTSCYAGGDFLLCHDDCLGDRKIAYILYLSENWESEDGGTLDLFDTDEYGQPRSIVKSILPEYNSLIFFEVVGNSYHQVSEILAVRKTRWSINGWFHGPVESSNKVIRCDPEIKYLNPEDTDVDLSLWISDMYLNSEIVKEIQEDVEAESVAFLSNFLKPDIYEELCQELQSDSIRWKVVGPADIRNYEVAEEDSLPRLLADFLKIFKSITIFQLLKNYTELDLVPESDSMNPRMTIELQRWTRGCYTLISDKNNYQSESELDEISVSTVAPDLSSTKHHIITSSPVVNHEGIVNRTEISTVAQTQDGVEIEVETEIEIEAETTETKKKSLINSSKSDSEEINRHCLTSESTETKKKSLINSSKSDSEEINGHCLTSESTETKKKSLINSSKSDSEEINGHCLTSESTETKKKSLINSSKSDSEEINGHCLTSESTETKKKSLMNSSKSDSEEINGHCLTSNNIVQSHKNYSEESSSSDKIDSNGDCNTPSSSLGGDDEDEDNNRVNHSDKDKLESKKRLSNKYSRASLLNVNNSCSVNTNKTRIDTDTDDSDVSDIGDYLSDPLDGEHSGQEDAATERVNSIEDDFEEERKTIEEPGSLDVIMQFNTRGLVDSDTIDYVDLKESNSTLIHVPAKDNHLCLVYKTLGTCRVHKYINYNCAGYFYNLVCTYRE